MKNALFLLLIGVLVMVSIVSCAPAEDAIENTTNTTYETYPFTDMVQPKMKDVSKNLYGTFKFATMSTLYHNWYVALKSDGTAAAAKVDSLYGGDGVYEGTWSLGGNALTLSIKGMTEFSNKELRWEDWEEDRLIKYYENSAYNGLLYKKYDEASLSVDSSSLVGLWIRTNDYGETDGYRFLSDGTVWRYYSDGDSLCMTWKESSEGNEIRITSGGGFNDYYNFVIIGDDLYLNSTRFTKVK